MTRLVTLAILLAGCSAELPSAPVAMIPSRVEIDRERPSTDGALALSNLDSMIAARFDSLALRPEQTETRAQLVGMLLGRAHYLGTYGDFDRAMQLVDEGAALEPNSASTLRLAAELDTALHRFPEARDKLEAAEVLDGDRDVLSPVTLAVAQGQDLGEALATAQDTAARAPSYASFVALASALAANERYEEADASFLRALNLYRDVSPFPLAWVAFQRGVMWGEQAARPDLARPLYEEAVRRLPNYVVANVHLAELEVLAGQSELAVARLERLLNQTEDPEPRGYLGELLLESDPERARELIDGADRTYASLLSRHRLAFLDHASEFYSGPGADPQQGLAMALENLARRRTARAHIVAIEAAMSARDRARSCELHERALTAPQSTALRRLLSETEALCD